MWLNIQRSDFGTKEQAPGITGDTEVDQPGFDDRVNDDHLATTATNVLECGHQPRMIAGRVATDEKDTVGMFDIFQRDGGCPCAEHAGQTHTTGLVAIKTAIVDVVCAVNAGKELEQKNRPRSNCGH